MIRLTCLLALLVVACSPPECTQNERRYVYAVDEPRAHRHCVIPEEG